MVLEIMQAYQLKMNPTKSFLGVSSGKILGFIVTFKGIHLELDKIKAIQALQPLKNIRELRGLPCLHLKIHRKSIGLLSIILKKGITFL